MAAAVPIPLGGMAGVPAPAAIVCTVLAGDPDKHVMLDQSEALVASTSFLPWEPVPAAAAGGAAMVRLPQWAMIKVFVGKCTFARTPLDLAFFLTHSVLELAFDGPTWGTVLTELVASGLLAASFSDVPTLLASISALSIATPANLVLDHTKVILGDPFNTPAVPGVAAIPAGRGRGRGRGRGALAVPAVPPVPMVPGPVELDFLALTNVLDLEDLASDTPSALFSFLAGVMGACLSDAARRSAGSTVRLSAEILTPQMHRYIYGGVGLPPSAALMASRLKDMLSEAIASFCGFMEAPTIVRAALTSELADMLRYLNGTPSEKAAVEAQRCSLVSPQVKKKCPSHSRPSACGGEL